jgi:hypothetical protein
MENEPAMKRIAIGGLGERRKATSGGMEIPAEERQIDRVLADSFPASDSPSWTLGVSREPATESAKLDADAKSQRR